MLGREEVAELLLGIDEHTKRGTKFGVDLATVPGHVRRRYLKRAEQLMLTHRVVAGPHEDWCGARVPEECTCVEPRS